MTKRKKLIKACDDLWSEIVKLRASGRCEMCGKNSYLNSHHIFSRNNYSTRWDISNGVCLCAGCHTLTTNSAHKAPADFVEWIKAKRGLGWYDDLRVKAHDIVKFSDIDLKETILVILKKEKDCA